MSVARTYVVRSSDAGIATTQPRLDAATRHHRVLDGEQQQEGQVDGHRDRGGGARRAVDGPGDDDAGEEARWSTA